ncbi:TonB-system energizer ExbB [Moraxella lincolnii]|uniref:TonB-system energizer ExbB n=1 Tax=Lwoffella lincolnii TaxID=90241 RepID=UPI00398448BD
MSNMPLLKLIVEYAILGLLLAMSMIAMAVAIERWRFYRHLVVRQYHSRAKLQKHLTKRLTIISSIASNAPYIGLLGTVFGIMLTFQTLGESGDIDVKSIITGLAFALKATAMGIAVAIPCVFINNFLARQVREKLADFDELNGQ